MFFLKAEQGSRALIKIRPWMDGQLKEKFIGQTQGHSVRFAKGKQIFRAVRAEKNVVFHRGILPPPPPPKKKFKK